jgi:hypothetical protein
MLKLPQGFPDDVLAVEGVGLVSAEDYRTVLVPEALEKMKTHKYLRLFCHLGKNFTGITPGAMWEDTKIGIGHWGAWGRMAVVTDVAWLADAVKLFAPLFHHPMRVFANAQYDEARAWIVEKD